MWLTQTLRWCTITGALLLSTVAVTYLHKQVAADPTGVETRWWDGTKKSVETYYRDGKVESRTEYGEDGKTVITYRKYDWQGNLQQEKIRLPNGNIEDSAYMFDGRKNVRLQYTLWLGDESNFILTQMYWQNGKMRMEVVKTDDGQVAKQSRQWDEEGVLLTESQILPNAANQLDQYEDGKLVQRQTLFGTGDMVTQTFRADGTMSNEEKIIRLTDTAYGTYFDARGIPVFGSEQHKDGTQVLILYKNGKPAVKHTAYKPNSPTYAEEISASTGTVTRKLEFDAKGNPSRVFIYRADGTLAREKHLTGTGNSTTVTRQLDYDATGTKVTATSDAGEPERFEPDMLDTTAAFNARRSGSK